MPKTPAEYRAKVVNKLSDPTIGFQATIRRVTDTYDQDSQVSTGSTNTDMTVYAAETQVQTRAGKRISGALESSDMLIVGALSFDFVIEPGDLVIADGITRVIKESKPAVQVGEAIAYELRLEV